MPGAAVDDADRDPWAIGCAPPGDRHPTTASAPMGNLESSGCTLSLAPTRSRLGPHVEGTPAADGSGAVSNRRGAGMRELAVFMRSYTPDGLTAQVSVVPHACTRCDRWTHRAPRVPSTLRWVRRAPQIARPRTMPAPPDARGHPPQDDAPWRAVRGGWTRVGYAQRVRCLALGCTGAPWERALTRESAAGA